MTDKEKNSGMHADGNGSPCNKVHHGNNVRHYRKKEGVTQEYMALKLNMLQPRFSELEKQAVIEDEMLEKIAEILDIDVECLKNEIPVPGTTNIIQNGARSVVNTGNETVNAANEQVQNEYNDSKTVHNPVDTEKIEKAFMLVIEQQKGTIDTQTELIKTLQAKVDKLTDQIITYAEKIETYALNKK